MEREWGRWRALGDSGSRGIVEAEVVPWGLSAAGVVDERVACVWVPRLWHLAPGAITGVGDWMHRGWAGGWTSAAFQALHLGTVCVYLLRGAVCPGAGSGALALLLALLVSDA